MKQRQAAHPDNTFFTSDLHFFHDNVIHFCDRPTTPDEQTDWLLQQVNQQLNDESDTYHLGDFSFTSNVEKLKDIISRLVGRWFFVLGNHDNESALREAVKGTQHVVLGHYKEIKIEKRRIVLCHFPIQSWNTQKYGALHLHGHTHGGMKTLIKNRMDVGIDTDCGHLPYSYANIIEKIEMQNTNIVWETQNDERMLIDYIESNIKRYDLSDHYSADEFVGGLLNCIAKFKM